MLPYTIIPKNHLPQLHIYIIYIISSYFTNCTKSNSARILISPEQRRHHRREGGVGGGNGEVFETTEEMKKYSVVES